MSSVFYTWAELEAFQMIAGTAPLSNRSGQVERAADRILDLAERIKNQRARATMNLAAEAACGVQPPHGLSREVWLKACGDYCAPDGTCSCAKFADDPKKCERRKEMERTYGVSETSDEARQARNGGVQR